MLSSLHRVRQLRHNSIVIWCEGFLWHGFPLALEDNGIERFHLNGIGQACARGCIHAGVVYELDMALHARGKVSGNASMARCCVPA
jgi:hypothetical protein